MRHRTIPLLLFLLLFFPGLLRAEEPVPSVLELTGQFIVERKAMLSSRVDGRILKILKTKGDIVRKGETVAVLDDVYLQLAVRAAQAAVQEATAMEKMAGMDLGRKSELIKDNTIPQAAFDAVSSQNDVAKAHLTRAEAESALHKRRLADASLTAPFDGIIAERMAEVGDYIGPGHPLMVLAQITPLVLRFSVPEKYCALLAKEMEVSCAVESYAGAEFTGAIKRIGPAVDDMSRSIPVEAHFDNSLGKLRAGMFAKVTLKLPLLATKSTPKS